MQCVTAVVCAWCGGACVLLNEQQEHDVAPLFCS